MDVTPISKTNMNMAKPERDSSSAHNAFNKSTAGIVSNPTEQLTQTIDPVKRAEQAIGGFFEDDRFPNGRFSIDQDESSGRYVYRLIDFETNEVIKQFPGDYVLRRVAFYRELQGLAVNSEV